MKTKSLNTLLKHKFFLYGMIALSLLQLVNFYRARSFACLGTFGVAYYLGCMMTKNKALCLLFAILVSTFIMGCEGRFVTFYEGMSHGDHGGGGSCEDHAGDEAACSAHPDCEYQPGDPDGDPPVQPSCVSTAAPAQACTDYTTAEDCTSPCNWSAESNTCQDPAPSPP